MMTKKKHVLFKFKTPQLFVVCHRLKVLVTANWRDISSVASGLAKSSITEAAQGMTTTFSRPTSVIVSVSN